MLGELAVTESPSKHQVDNIAVNLNQCMLSASQEAVPLRGSAPHQKPYWDTELAELHACQLRKREVWIASGRPRGMHHESFKEYKISKRKFASSLKKKAAAHYESKYEFVEQNYDLDVERFWRSIKQKKKNCRAHP